AIDPAAMDALEKYAWPGNVRELKNSIEHALIFAQAATLKRDDFPAVLLASGDVSLAARPRSLEDLEKEAILATLESTHYKIAQAADILGISRKTLLEKRKKYGLV
ncbi:MAG TPA: helix-turn-helix domain-containing protein, partial [Candidatus Dormibacteraeota bacterium]|nr:helix-turn-helix domain-containing protein [Candidatus Dormibacteraeota bacterium]